MCDWSEMSGKPAIVRARARAVGTARGTLSEKRRAMPEKHFPSRAICIMKTPGVFRWSPARSRRPYQRQLALVADNGTHAAATAFSISGVVGKTEDRTPFPLEDFHNGISGSHDVSSPW